MQRINWEMSRDKWKPIVALLEKPGRVDWGELYVLLNQDCGHCKEYDQDCHKCSLYNFSSMNKLCSGVLSDCDEFMILEMITCGEIPRNKRRALSIARRIYKAILKDEPGGEGDEL